MIERLSVEKVPVEKSLDEKPDLLALSAAKPGFFPAFLESQSLNEKIGRYSILFAAPSLELVAFNEQQFNQLLSAVDTVLDADNQNSSGPFQFGWVVYFSYESSYLMEPKLRHLMSESDQPLAVAIYCQGAIVHDHINDQVTLYAQSEAVADYIQANIKQQFMGDVFAELVEVKQAPEEVFEKAVITAKELICSGDIYQANLSRQYHFVTNSVLPPAAIMQSLKAVNPAPFAGMLQVNQFAVISSSPERLFSIRNGRIETRPIAGTRPRGDSESADLKMIEELLNTPKERAEHIMLIDLERNDMGKICQTGSIKVNELMVVESYQHVHHIVSNIEGQLKSDTTFVSALKALFPGGTITGCPKIRCIEIIRDIEQKDRGCYTGSMGYINHDGQVDLNILIRTVGMNDQQIKFNAGAGIVYDSDPKAELQETKDKARGLLNALSHNEFKQQGNIQ